MDRLKNLTKSTRDALSRPLRRSSSSTSSSTSSLSDLSPSSEEASTTASIKSGVQGPRQVDVNDFATSSSSSAAAGPSTTEKPLPPPPPPQQAEEGYFASPQHNALPRKPLPTAAPIPARRSSLQRPAGPSPVQTSGGGGRGRPPLTSGSQSSIRIQRAVPVPAKSHGPPGRHPTTMPTLAEETPASLAAAPPDMPQPATGRDAEKTTPPPPPPRKGFLGRMGTTVWAKVPRYGGRQRKAAAAAEVEEGPAPRTEYASKMVDVLDTLDPEVATLTSLTNVQNSLFVPDLGRYINRRPTYTLSSAYEPDDEDEKRADAAELNQAHQELEEMSRRAERTEQATQAPSMKRADTDVATLKTLDSRLSSSRYAVLPHGADLADWSYEDKKELNEHVRHMLHSRRYKFRRTMRGFGQYVRRPLGFLVTLYATLITLFGLAWVLFLIGWINVGGRQLYVVNVIDNVLVALFAIVGDGLAPFRARDTYHMLFVARYHHLTRALRRRHALPPLADHNDLPTHPPDLTTDLEAQPAFSVLTPTQQARLAHHQSRLARSHTFYRPHETATHRAFPHRLLVAVVLLLDGHSAFQIALGTCTWAIDYRRRPFALTTVILCCSIACNAAAGIAIWIGDRRTRKPDVLERLNRQELTAEAMGWVERRREEEELQRRKEEEEVEEERRKIAERAVRV